VQKVQNKSHVKPNNPDLKCSNLEPLWPSSFRGGAGAGAGGAAFFSWPKTASSLTSRSAESGHAGERLVQLRLLRRAELRVERGQRGPYKLHK
jgi:hypothetical protein